jgi:peptidoglycan/LPS O-acetylase OafA/YrhL
MMTTLVATEPIAQIPIKPKRYVLALDGVRFLAILVVILKHTGLGATSTFLPLRILGSLVKIGGGVPLFFIISGYLITGILLDTRSSANRYRNFIARRSLRIFPLYFAYLALVIGTTRLFASTKFHNIWVFAFYLQNVFLHRANNFGSILPVYHLWTLGVQEQFYLVWPFLIWSCSTLRRVRGLCWSVLIGSFLIRAFITIHLGDLPLADQMMPSRAGEMCLGALLAVERYDESWLSRVWPKLMPPLAVLMVLFVFLRFEDGRVGLVLVEVTLAFLAACLLAAALVPNSLTTRILSNRVLTGIGGKYSYGLFMFHPSVLLFCEKVLRLGHTTANGIERIVITLSASLVLAVLSYHLFEKPFLTLKRFFAARPNQSPAAASDKPESAPVFSFMGQRRRAS